MIIIEALFIWTVVAILTLLAFAYLAPGNQP
jgi:hypothetical protein